MENELEFLRYFYENVSHALGPADDEVYHMIKVDYVTETGNSLPEGYELNEDE